MKTYIIRRLLLMPLTLLGVTFLVFCITRFVPGGPIEQMMQQQSMSAFWSLVAIQRLQYTALLALPPK